MINLREATNRLEDGIITLSGPALAISGILAGVDLLTGGTMMTHTTWLQFAWAITLLISLDFQVLALGARAHRIYQRRGWWELVLAIVIAAAISYVSIQMQSIIARANSAGLDIATATAQLGINPIALIWERSALVLVLIFLAGWLRETESEQPSGTYAIQSHKDEQGQVSVTEEEQSAISEIAAISPPHESAREGKIYQLVDPRTDKPFYIGQAKYRIEERFHDHLTSSVNPFKKSIIDELQKEGLQPRIEMVETTHWDALNEREQYWMDKLREEGCYLTNMQPAPLSTTSTEQTRRKLTDERLLQFIAAHPEMKQKEIAQQLYVSESRISRLLKKQTVN